MSWVIEGKISEWTVAADVKEKNIKFKIKATNEYQIKRGNIIYNIIWDESNPSGDERLLQDKEFAINQYKFKILLSSKDNIMRFAFTDKDGNNIESITVK